MIFWVLITRAARYTGIMVGFGRNDGRTCVLEHGNRWLAFGVQPPYNPLVSRANSRKKAP